MFFGREEEKHSMENRVREIRTLRLRNATAARAGLLKGMSHRWQRCSMGLDSTI